MVGDRRACARRILKAYVAAALVAATAACAGAPASSVAVAPEIVEAPPVPTSSTPAQSPVQRSADTTVAAAVPAATGARALVGIGREALVARLGPASFVRRDGPAEVWRYQAADCYFEAFLYRDNLLGQRVAHVDARARQGGRPMPVDACFTQLGGAPRS
jgi:hypothetical protein